MSGGGGGGPDCAAGADRRDDGPGYYQAAELNQKTNLKDCRACMNIRDQKNCTYKLMSFKNCSEELG